MNLAWKGASQPPVDHRIQWCSPCLQVAGWWWTWSPRHPVVEPEDGLFVSFSFLLVSSPPQKKVDDGWWIKDWFNTYTPKQYFPPMDPPVWGQWFVGLWVHQLGHPGSVHIGHRSQKCTALRPWGTTMKWDHCCKASKSWFFKLPLLQFLIKLVWGNLKK